MTFFAIKGVEHFDFNKSRFNQHRTFATHHLGMLLINPCNSKDGLNLLGETNAGAGIGSEKDARNAQTSRQLASSVEDKVLTGSEGARVVRHVVGDDDEGPAFGVFWSAYHDVPYNHADLKKVDERPYMKLWLHKYVVQK